MFTFCTQRPSERPTKPLIFSVLKFDYAQNLHVFDEFREHLDLLSLIIRKLVNNPLATAAVNYKFHTDNQDVTALVAVRSRFLVLKKVCFGSVFRTLRTFGLFPFPNRLYQ